MPLCGILYLVLHLVKWYMPTIGQRNMVQSPLAFTSMNIAHIIHLWGQVGLDLWHQHSGFQCYAQNNIVSHISSIVLQWNLTQLPVGLLYLWSAAYLVSISAIQQGPSLLAAEIKHHLILRWLSSWREKSSLYVSQALPTVYSKWGMSSSWYSAEVGRVCSIQLTLPSSCKVVV